MSEFEAALTMTLQNQVMIHNQRLCRRNTPQHATKLVNRVLHNKVSLTPPVYSAMHVENATHTQLKTVELNPNSPVDTVANLDT